jgi:glutamate receptor ionotropic, NMDA 1
MKNAQARVYLMYASKLDAEIIFRDAADRNMTEAGYVWIVTEQALDANNVPEGTIGLKLVNASNELAHIYDSMYAYYTFFLVKWSVFLYVLKNTNSIFLF